MRASDLIRELQAEIGVHGDLEVRMYVCEQSAGINTIEFDAGGEFPFNAPVIALVTDEDC